MNFLGCENRPITRHLPIVNSSNLLSLSFTFHWAKCDDCLREENKLESWDRFQNQCVCKGTNLGRQEFSIVSATARYKN
jgi:hypothetical protein